MKELLISAILGIVVLGLDILKLRKLILPVILLSLGGMLAACVMDWNLNEVPFSMSTPMLLMDHFALGFIAVLSFLLLIWFLLNYEYFGSDSRKTDLFALVLFSFSGAVIMVSYTNLIMLFLGIEILSIPVYVLAASKRGDQLSNEAGFKYFFMGSMASAILLFGISLVYGSTGSFDLHAIASAATEKSGGIFAAGVIMILSGFAFKISAAPFHLWAPDVYQGSPTPVTALMASVVKGAAFAALFRLLSMGLEGVSENYLDVFSILAALTLISANVVALVQKNAKRLLAYSSISHAGFMLGAVMLVNQGGGTILLYYVLTYGLASLIAFVVLHHVSSIQNGFEEIDAFRGLVKRNPVLAGSMTLALLSMAGIPPLSGFLAKYFVIAGVIGEGFTWLAIVMILVSVAGAYYYLKLIIAMFTPIENAGRIFTGRLTRWVIVLVSILMVALFFGAYFLEMI